ncbi:MAG: cytochrome c oxidase subunit II [Acidobacteriota bacterium]
MNFSIPLFPEQASTAAPVVDNLYFFLTAVSGFFTILIFILVMFFAIKYRRRSEDERPRPVESSLRLEMTWIIIPLILAMIMFVWGAAAYFDMYTPPEDAIEIYVVGKQWMWKVQHPTGQREINELHVPAGHPVRLVMSSEDVIHSFYVPAFRVKKDVVPGRYNYIWFEATKTGEYHLFCAEYCGTQHSFMRGRVVVMEPLEYQTWLSGGSLARLTLAEAGQSLFQELGCNTCHHAQAGARGPALTGLFGQEVPLVTGETVIADEQHLRESILNPTAKIVAGYSPIMPTFQGRVNQEELNQLVEYIKSLGAPVSPQMQIERDIQGPGENEERTNQNQ